MSKARSFVSLTTPYDSIAITIIIAVGFQLVGGVTQMLTIVLVTIFFSSITGALNSLNHITDVESDKLVWERRPLAKETLSRRDALLFTSGLLILAWSLFAVLLFTSFSYLLLFVGLFDSALPLLYSLRPVRLRRIPILKNLVPPIHVIILPYLTVLSLGAGPLTIPPSILFILVLDGAATLMISDVVSVKGDERLDGRTLPMILGMRASRIVIQGIFLLVLGLAIGLYLTDVTKIFWVAIIAEQTLLLLISSRILPLGTSKIISHASDLISVSVGTTVIVGFILGLL